MLLDWPEVLALLMPDLESIRVFVEVATRRSFSAAARRLEVSQPAVSQRVAALEGELGFPLLDRSTRPLGVTEEGRIYLEGARDVLAELARLDRRVRRAGARSAARAGAGAAKPVRLAAIYSGGIGWLSGVSASAAAGAALDIDFGSHAEVEQRVIDGDADLALVSFPDQIDRSAFDWAVEPLHEEPMAVICPPQHPLAREPRIAARHLRGVPLIGFSDDMRVGRATLDYLASAGVDGGFAHAFDNMDTLKSAVLGTGLPSILPLPVVAADLEAGRLKAVALTPDLVRPLGLVAARDTFKRPDVQGWIERLRAASPLAGTAPPEPALAH